MSLARRLLEPRHWSDKLLYALQSILLPGTAAVVTREGFPVCAIMMIALWVLYSFYTIEWVLEKVLERRVD